MDDSGTFGKKRLPAGFEVNDRRGGEEQLASDGMRALIKTDTQRTRWQHQLHPDGGAGIQGPNRRDWDYN